MIKDKLMETISVEILNPKAKQLLLDLADLKLITLKPKLTLTGLLENMRNNSESVPSLDEITAEVEKVRLARNAKKA
jgi:hypothetical protein